MAKSRKTGSSKEKKSSKKVKKKNRDSFVLKAVLIALAAIAVVVIGNLPGMPFAVTDKDLSPRADYTGSCVFDFIDVGQGDSTLITTPSGEFILVDTGTSDTDDLMDYLVHAGVDNIEYLILTHPHEDHIGGAVKVLKKYDVGCVIMPDVIQTDSLFNRLYDALMDEKKDGCKVYSAAPGDKYEIDGCNIDIVGPVECNKDALNNCSVSMTFTYKDFTALLTGDSEADAEKLMLSSGARLDCDLYKAAHHGSNTSNTAEFLAAASPDITVVSCGKDNSYGHPHDEVLKRFEDIGSEIYITAKNGSVTVITDGDGYDVDKEK